MGQIITPKPLQLVRAPSRSGPSSSPRLRPALQSLRAGEPGGGAGAVPHGAHELGVAVGHVAPGSGVLEALYLAGGLLCWRVFSYSELWNPPNKSMRF